MEHVNINVLNSLEVSEQIFFNLLVVLIYYIETGVYLYHCSSCVFSLDQSYAIYLVTLLSFILPVIRFILIASGDYIYVFMDVRYI